MHIFDGQVNRWSTCGYQPVFPSCPYVATMLISGPVDGGAQSGTGYTAYRLSVIFIEFIHNSILQSVRNLWVITEKPTTRNGNTMQSRWPDLDLDQQRPNKYGEAYAQSCPRRKCPVGNVARIVVKGHSIGRNFIGGQWWALSSISHSKRVFWRLRKVRDIPPTLRWTQLGRTPLGHSCCTANSSLTNFVNACSGPKIGVNTREYRGPPDRCENKCRINIFRRNVLQTETTFAHTHRRPEREYNSHLEAYSYRGWWRSPSMYGTHVWWRIHFDVKIRRL